MSTLELRMTRLLQNFFMHVEIYITPSIPQQLADFLLKRNILVQQICNSARISCIPSRPQFFHNRIKILRPRIIPPQMIRGRIQAVTDRNDINKDFDRGYCIIKIGRLSRFTVKTLLMPKGNIPEPGKLRQILQHLSSCLRMEPEHLKFQITEPMTLGINNTGA